MDYDADANNRKEHPFARGCSMNLGDWISVFNKTGIYSILWNGVIIATRCCACQFIFKKNCKCRNLHANAISLAVFNAATVPKAPVKDKVKQRLKTERQ